MSSPRPQNPLLSLLGRALESVLNRAVALDDETEQRLKALNGRAIAIDFAGVGVAMRIAVENDLLHVGPAFAAAADLKLRASPASFLAMALRRGESSSLPAGKVEISGDAELARRIEKLVRNFQPDIEEAFTRVFGDVIGYQIAQAFKRAFDWSRESAKNLVQDSADFLRDESRDLVAPAEMEQFLDEVDTLRDDTDRLEARIARLSQNLQGRRA
ncbi:sterol-binding protein [Pseudolysobacter antarcticus]|uniref:Ubiquinone biosynthesis accessory factor UbiJ n=1 Tax=Pseudolysobacter antarcticus TaxID=2511995 RepID=A0A411HEW6_9GAMM|nr:SCP2 sterol-binding domain-containing protein [Pseudolysobacter antarcticus]QBB68994.1 sterol-binding protein [Pseudolysobacter antarcticus]